MAPAPPEDDDPASPVEPRGAASADHRADLDASFAEEVDGEIDGGALPRVIATGRFSGPLPPPAALKEYDEVVPGLAEVIVDQWKSETAHRHATIDGLRQLDHHSLVAYYDAERRGQTFALILGLSTVAVAIIAILLDRQAVGVGAVVLAAGSIVWAMRRSSAGPPDDASREAGGGEALEVSPEPADAVPAGSDGDDLSV